VKARIAALGAALFFVLAQVAEADHRALLAKIDSDDFALPVPETLGEPFRLWATWYNIPAVEATREGYPLRNVGGKPISPPVSGREWCDAALQGVITIHEPDGSPRTYTFEATSRSTEVDCGSFYKHAGSWASAAGRSRFGISKGPYGDGAGGYQLVPFRSVAVNTRLIPLGTVLYIPAARGTSVTLPSGRKVQHDGYFFASDRGGDIHRDHIDVFVGHSKENPFPSFISSTPRDTFEAYVIDDGRVKPRLRNLHAID
jgi:3D (Asp-Asp-Asp) domain-containing protein